MNIRLLLSVSCLSFLVLAGCSPGTIIRTKEYEGKSLEGKSLAIARITPSILNSDDVVDDLGKGVAQDVFEDFFEKEFIAEMLKRSTFGVVSYLAKRPLPDLGEREVDFVKQEKLRFSLPRQGQLVRCDSLTPDFVLFISQLVIGRGDAKSGTYVPGAPGSAGYFTGGSFGNLNFHATFALWDNLEGRLVTYGRTGSESQIMFFAMTKGNWEGCTHDLAREILKNSPFEKKR
jgi:hypothetical protein